MSTADAGSTEFSHPIADLYGRWALNPLVDIARVLAHDIVVRPQNYQQLPDDVAEILTGFRFKLGSDPDWPDAFQRTLNFKILHQVSVATPPLREAALLIGQNPEGHRNALLLDAFRDAVAAVRNQLAPLEGRALAMVSDGTRPIFERAVRLFQAPQIARAFALPPAPASDWPLAGNFSGAGAYLVSEMTKSLRKACLGNYYRRIDRETSPKRQQVPMVMVALPQDKFIILQKAAYFGALTISSLLLPDDNLNEQEFANNVYKWTKSLQRLVPNVERAWKDLEYRSRLTDLEWGMVPNPSGETTPFSTSSPSFSTATVFGEICCSTGELICDSDPTSRWTDFCTEFGCPSIAVAPPGCLTPA